jgi:uncharacterized protein
MWGAVLEREPLIEWYYRDRTPTCRKGHGASAVGGELGRAGAASARQLRGLRALGLEAEMAGGAWRLALGAVLHRIRRGPAEAVLRPFPEGLDNGWEQQPRVLLQVRHIDRFVQRHENEWPLARTQWTPYYLHFTNRALTLERPPGNARIEYDALGEGITFSTPPFARETEITGPCALKLLLSSSTTDADVFAVLRVFAPDGREIVFQGALDPHTPIGQGWLRASHRKLDPALSLPYRSYHAHDELEPLTPGCALELDIEIWPTCIVVPAGYRIALTVRGRDYEYEGEAATLSNMKHPMRGCGPFVHDDPTDRPPEIFGGKVTLHAEEGRSPYLLLPVIP